MTQFIEVPCICKGRQSSCPNCSGTGRASKKACRRCNGTGKNGNAKCPDCRGDKWRELDNVTSY